MKECVATLFTSFKKSSPKKRKKDKQSSRSLDRGEASFGSTATSLSDDSSISFRLQTTPRSILPPPPPLSVTAHGLFSAFDRDGDGRIARGKLEAVLRQLGPNPPTAEEVAAMVDEVDLDGDGFITLDEFSALGAAAFGSIAAAGVGAGGHEELQEAFKVFDADGNGKISPEELREVFVAIGEESCTIEDCRRMIRRVDSDGDGLVCFKDFARLMDGQMGW